MTDVQELSTVAPQEAISNGEFLAEIAETLAGMGNHETKALLILYLSTTTDEFMPCGQLCRGFREFVGRESAWPEESTQPYRFCLDSLEPIGQVARGKAADEKARSIAYALSDKGREIGIPLAGLLLDWSLRYPDISLQQLFGTTHSKGKTRAPQHRLRVLLELLSAPKDGLATTDMVDVPPSEWRTTAYHTNLSNIDNAVDGLQQAGVVRTENVNDENSRQFVIVDPTLPERNYYRTEEVKSVYNFMQNKFAKGETTFTYDECLQAVIAHFQQTQPNNLDVPQLRTRVTQMLSSRTNKSKSGVIYRPLPGVERLENYNEGKHTKVYLEEEYVDALSELAQIVLAVDYRDPATLAYGRAQANAIAQDPAAKRTLIAKAREFSAAAQKLPREVTAMQLVTLLREAGRPLDAEEVLQTYRHKHKRPLSQATIKIMLHALQKADEIVVTKEQSRADIRKLRNFYTVLSPQE